MNHPHRNHPHRNHPHKNHPHRDHPHRNYPCMVPRTNQSQTNQQPICIPHPHKLQHSLIKQEMFESYPVSVCIVKLHTLYTRGPVYIP